MEDKDARLWYLNEAKQSGWSTRTLDRNIATQYYNSQDVGQMDMYVRMYDELKCRDGDNPTLGIVLCSETSNDIARFSVLNDNERLFMSKYISYLPSKEELKREIEKQKEVFYQQHPQLDGDE